MADFDTPFAQTADKRYPTAQEHLTGFPCGPADQQLFNGLFHRIESEIGAVIADAGIVQSDSDLTQLLQAINALIAAATGGNPAGYVLMSQARARLPIFPHVETINGQFGVLSPATGVVRLPAGVTFQHRGIFAVTTVQTDFNTDPSKIYHLRWNPTDGFTLNDLADTDYNPTAIVETNAAFDSEFDDMLVARVITNSSNVPTVTNLTNKNALDLTEILEQLDVVKSNENGANFRFTSNYNWARSPKSYSLTLARSVTPGVANDSDFNITASTVDRNNVFFATPSLPVTRYMMDCVVMKDDTATLSMLFSAHA